MNRLINLTLIIFITIVAISCLYIRAYAKDSELNSETEQTTTSNIMSGFYTENGKTYYYRDGKKVLGWLELKNEVYYFDAAGVMQTGLVKVDKKTYFFNSKGHGIKKGFVKCFDKKTRFGLGGGEIAIGPKKIKGKCYFFNVYTGNRHVKGLFKYKGRKYYSKGKGLLKTGYKAFKNKKTKKWYGIYFSKKSGRQVKGKTIGHLKIPKSGVLPQAYAYGIKKLDKHGWKLRKAFRYSVRLAYYGQLFRTSSSEKYAMRGFKHGHGNCYVMAATFYIQAKLLGYNAKQVEGYVGSAPHSWVTIKHKHGKRVYDPDFQHETGRWGYKIYYGKPGTWRYNSFHNMG